MSEYFEGMTDPRQEAKVRHSFIETIMIVMLVGVSVDESSIEAILDLASFVGYYMGKYKNNNSHVYHENKVVANVKYKNNVTGTFVYKFTTCERDDCPHFDGFHMYGTIYNYGFPIKRYSGINYNFN